MHKIVNGERVELSSAEALEKEAEWERAEVEKVSKNLEKENAIQDKIAILRDSGIKDDAIAIILPQAKEILAQP